MTQLSYGSDNDKPPAPCVPYSAVRPPASVLRWQPVFDLAGYFTVTIIPTASMYGGTPSTRTALCQAKRACPDALSEREVGMSECRGVSTCKFGSADVDTDVLLRTTAEAAGMFSVAHTVTASASVMREEF
jgi:hypothetical protein